MIIFDLDGTLSILGDRLKYLKLGMEDWDSFFEACAEDTINEPIATIFRALRNTTQVLKIVTGRPERVRQKTLDWLEQNDLSVASQDLHMRSDNDFRHDSLIKPELIIDFKDQIEMIFEDRNSMVEKWRKLGFVCLQVAEGNF